MSYNTRLSLKTIQDGVLAGTITSEEISLDSSQGIAIVASSSTISLSNNSFDNTDVLLSGIYINAHGYKLGLKVRFTTSGTLPAGLAVLTDYYLTDLTSNAIFVSASYDDVLGGQYITLADGGSGTHTITPIAALPVTMKIEGTIDGEVWPYVNDSLKELIAEPYMQEHETSYYHKARVVITVPSGQHQVKVKVMIKGR